MADGIPILDRIAALWPEAGCTPPDLKALMYAKPSAVKHWHGSGSQCADYFRAAPWWSSRRFVFVLAMIFLCASCAVLHQKSRLKVARGKHPETWLLRFEREALRGEDKDCQIKNEPNPRKMEPTAFHSPMTFIRWKYIYKWLKKSADTQSRLRELVSSHDLKATEYLNEVRTYHAFRGRWHVARRRYYGQRTWQASSSLLRVRRPTGILHFSYKGLQVKLAIHRWNKRDSSAAAYAQTPSELLPMYENSDCTEPMDHVYALYNLIGEHSDNLQINQHHSHSTWCEDILLFLDKHEPFEKNHTIKMALTPIRLVPEARVNGMTGQASPKVTAVAFDRGAVRRAEESVYSTHIRGHIKALHPGLRWLLQDQTQPVLRLTHRMATEILDRVGQ